MFNCCDNGSGGTLLACVVICPVRPSCSLPLSLICLSLKQLVPTNLYPHIHLSFTLVWPCSHSQLISPCLDIQLSFILIWTGAINLGITRTSQNRSTPVHSSLNQSSPYLLDHSVFKEQEKPALSFIQINCKSRPLFTLNLALLSCYCFFISTNCWHPWSTSSLSWCSNWKDLLVRMCLKCCSPTCFHTGLEVHSVGSIGSIDFVHWAAFLQPIWSIDRTARVNGAVQPTL